MQTLGVTQLNDKQTIFLGRFCELLLEFWFSFQFWLIFLDFLFFFYGFCLYFPSSTVFCVFFASFTLLQVAFNNFHSYFLLLVIIMGFLLLLFAGCLFRVHFPFTCKISHNKFTENISPLPLSELGFSPLSFSLLPLLLPHLFLHLHHRLFLPHFVAQLWQLCIFSHFLSQV